jgi:hypothetical protein
MSGKLRRCAVYCGSVIQLRFAQRLEAHNAEFNPCDVVTPVPPKRASSADSTASKRQKLESLEEADLAELMKAVPVCIAVHAMYTLLMARPATGDSACTVWIAAKCDMDLDPNDVLFAFGTGRPAC